MSVADEQEGTALLKEVERAIFFGKYAAGEPEAPPCDLTLLGAIDAYLEAKRGEGRAESGIRRYIVSRRAISLSPIGNCRVADLAPADVERFMKWRRTRKWRARPRGRRTRRRRGGSRRHRRLPTRRWPR